MKLYCYSRCFMCRKARNWLDENGFEYSEQDLMEDTPTYEQLKELYEKSNLPLINFFNVNGKVFKEKKLKNKIKEMSEEEQLKLLSTDGWIIKRPIFDGGDVVVTGFRENEWNDQLK